MLQTCSMTSFYKFNNSTSVKVNLPYAVAVVADKMTGMENKMNPEIPPNRPTIQNTTPEYIRGSMIDRGNCKEKIK